MTDFVPRYHEIEQALRSRIAELAPHAPLPSDAQLCEEFGVSRMTARGAVQRLVQEGLVYRVPGRGTFVAPARANRTASRILSFSDEMRRRGRTPESRVVQKRRAARERCRAPPARASTRCSSCAASGSADGEPLALETAVFPAAKVEPVLEGRRARRLAVRHAGRRRPRPDGGLALRSQAEAATAEDAKLLGVKRGEPLLVERRLIHDQAGVPLELTESRYVGSRYGLDVDFEVELPG